LFARTPPPPIDTVVAPLCAFWRLKPVLPLLTTVGIVTAISEALRPGVGSASSCVRSRTVPWDALDVSISGDAPETVTDSSIAPTSMTVSSVTNCWVAIVRPSRSNFL
jgi:hypothetical protein